MRFKLVAKISSDNPDAVRPIVQEFVKKHKGSVREDNSESHVAAETEGENARDQNRALLTALRKAEKRTRLRAQWIHGSEAEHFFDYVPKRKERLQS